MKETKIIKRKIGINKYSHIRLNINDESEYLLIVPSGMKVNLTKGIKNNVENWFETDFPNYIFKNTDNYSTINFTWFATSEDNKRIRNAYFDSYMNEFRNFMNWVVPLFKDKKIVFLSSSLSALLTFKLIEENHYWNNNIESVILGGGPLSKF